MRTARNQRTRKIRQTFSVAPDVVDVLDDVRKLRKLRSRSAALEAIVREQNALERRRAISQSITDFYDNLSESERAEERAWGAFSVAQWAKRKE